MLRTRCPIKIGNGKAIKGLMLEDRRNLDIAYVPAISGSSATTNSDSGNWRYTSDMGALTASPKDVTDMLRRQPAIVGRIERVGP